MREIKFRAWDKTSKAMIKNYAHVGAYGELYVARFHSLAYSETGCPDLVIMQYTGLKDNNGKEIFEGDRVRAWIYSDETPSELEVYYSGSGFIIDYQDSDSDYFYIGDFPGSIEVIGNIYEEGGKE